jgi:type IV pilus assembly protein PilC
MAVFKYEAMPQKGGNRKSGIITAENSAEATFQIRKGQMAVLKLKELRTASMNHNGKNVKRSTFEKKTVGILTKKINIEQFFRQLAALLVAGVPILEALRTVAEQAPPLLSRALTDTAARVGEGKSFRDALKSEATFIGNISIGLVSVGEANGSLDEMCLFAASLLERKREIKSKIIQALTYPSVVVFIAAGTGYFLMSKVIPKITKFIAARSGEMPAATKALVYFSDFIKSYGLFFVLIPMLFAVSIFFGRKNRILGEKIDFIFLKVPLLGKILAASGNSVWTRTLGILLRSGINILSAIDLTRDTLKNIHIKEQFNVIKKVVEQGQPLSTGMNVTTLAGFSPLAEAMVRIGENTGTVDNGLLYVAEFSEDELDRRLGLLMKLVEPALFIVVGGMVGFVYIAFFMGLMAASRSVG